MGIVTTIVVMNVFNAAQPALLYIVPGVLGATFIRAVIAGEVSTVWTYCEGLEEAQAERDAAENAKNK
jgi:minor histocompatibility antigen H13